jgi:SOS-response transcriptional repressor LexA
MSDETVVEMNRAEYVVLQLALPGRPVSNVGVYLLDASADRGHLRLKPDWETVAGEDDREVLERLEDDLRQVAEEMGGKAFLAYLEDSFSNVIQLTQREALNVGGYARALARLYERHVEPIPVRRFVTHLPLYSVRAAATRFGEDMEVEEEGWLEAPQALQLDQRMFVARVVGRSMEPLIPDGSLCVFRAEVVGSRQGKRLLVWEEATSESGGRYTVKRYRSNKLATGPAEDDESWEHGEIVLEPLNPDFEPMRYNAGDEGRGFRVIGEFVQVVEE